MSVKEERVCKIHGLQVHHKYKNKWVCRKCCTEATQRRRVRVKRKAVDYLGGCCQICGYNDCIDALDFHHLDPVQKEFSISHDGVNVSYDKLKKELDKCILLCANCHREVHASLKQVLPLQHMVLEDKRCAECGKLFKPRKEKQRFCSAVCSSLHQRKCDRPDEITLIKEIKESSYVSVGKKYGVRDNTIRKWVIQYGINPKTLDKSE